MHLVRGHPHRALAEMVGGYADFAERTNRPKETGELPGRSVVVIVDLEAGWTVEGARLGSFAGGLYARPVLVRHEGVARGVQFDLEPPAVRALLGVPAGELAQLTVSLEELLGADARRFAECLDAADGPRQRFAALDELLLKRLSRTHWQPTPDLVRAWGRLRATGGRIRIDQLATELGCSRRHLAKRFKQDVGVSPKLAARPSGSSPRLPGSARSRLRGWQRSTVLPTKRTSRVSSARWAVRRRRCSHSYKNEPKPGVSVSAMTQTVFPCLTFTDAEVAIDWLERALGAERLAAYEDNDGRITHAEIRIGATTIMAGDQRAGSTATPPGMSVIYVVVPDVDIAYERAKNAGAQVTEPTEQDYGSRDITVTDPDGNRWALGTYSGVAPVA